MANLYFSGFENANAYTQIPNFVVNGDHGFVSSGRFGSGRYMQFNQYGSVYVNFTNTSSDTIIFGGAYYFDSWGFSNEYFMILTDTNNTYTTNHISLRIGDRSGTTGTFKLYGPTGTLLGSGSAGEVSTGTWYYIEVKAKIHDTLGEVTVKVDGASVISVSNVDTKNGSLNQYPNRAYFKGEGSNNMRIDDIYINDTAGSSPHNDFYGEIRIDGLSPTSDNSVQFTRSAGSNNYANVDDGTSPDDDSTYNYSSTVGHKDLLGLSGYTTASGATILGVGITTRAKRADPGTRTFRNVVKSSSTEVTGSTVTLTSTYINVRQNVYTDPATSVAFANATAINNLKVGYEIVA